MNCARLLLWVSICATLVGGENARSATPSWQSAGADLSNSHAILSPAGGGQLNPSTAGSLHVIWTFSTVGDIASAPTVEPGGLYATDWGGWIYKLDPPTGTLLWQHKLSEYTGVSTSSSRNSAAIGPDSVVLADRVGGRVLCLAKSDGHLLWMTQVETHPAASITASPIIYNNTVYVAVASSEEGLVSNTYRPSFRGSIVALSLNSGVILWKFWTVPPGYTGGGSWGSNMIIYPPTNSLIFSTGNNYSIPTSISDCVARVGSSIGYQLGCLDPTDYVDALVSVDASPLNNGHLNWWRRVSGADTWVVGCNLPGKPGCQNTTGRDWDFASAPNLIHLPSFTGVPDDRGGTSNGYILGAGQKSGVYYALNPGNGGLFWSKQVAYGEIMWGSALDLVDAGSIYIADANLSHLHNVLAGRNGVPQPWNSGSIASVNTSTGKLAWQIPAYGNDLANPGFGSAAKGPIAFTNKVVFAGSTSGYMTALDSTGRLLWTFNAGRAVSSGPAVFDDMVFWGTGQNGGNAAQLYGFGID